MDQERETLLAVFSNEAEENLAAFEEALMRLESAPDDPEVVATLFRAAHTLKGNAAALGVDTMAALAHELESILDSLRKRKLEVTPPLVDVMLSAHDVLRSMLVSVANGVTPEVRSDLIARLQRAANGDLAGVQRSASPVRRAPRRTLRVDLRTLDRILTHTGELSVALARLRTQVAAGGSDEAIADVERLFADLRDQVMRVRLVPVGPLFRQQARTVRDIAASHGKRAQLRIEGEDVEVDTAIVDLLRDPVTHMIRNAIDHAIETPAARIAARKPVVATVTLRARHEGSQIVVQVSDDGAGFQRERILARARAIGLSTASAERDDAELFKLVFAPGFSTADGVSDLSGRGVGLDVVARNVVAMKGTITVQSVEGVGSTFSIRVPLTLAMISGFAVSIASDTFVIPMAAVRECVDLASCGNQRGVLRLRGDLLPWLRLRDMFGIPGEPPAHEDLVVVEHDGRRAGLAVDRLAGETQAVVQSLGTLLRGASGISGSTILGDGRVGLILDVPAVLRRCEKSHAARTA